MCLTRYIPFRALQDILTKEIVTALDVELVSGERGRHQRARFRDPEAGEAFYRGLAQFNKFDETSNSRARSYFEQVTRLEPDSILGYVQLALARQQEVLMGWSNDSAASIENMGALLEQALVESPEIDSPCYTLGWYQMFDERPLVAIENLKRSIRLIPVVTAPRASVLGTCYRNSGQLDLAVSALEEAVQIDPAFNFARVVLASCYSEMNSKTEAKREVGEILRRDNTYTVSRYTSPNLYRNKKTIDKWPGALRKAGLPE